MLLQTGCRQGGLLRVENEKLNYPMPRVYCGAKTRSGGLCRQPAMPNGRCRLHGGKSKSGKEHGRYRIGEYTKEAIKKRREIRDLLNQVKRIIMEA
jgi:hypothetical protein